MCAKISKRASRQIVTERSSELLSRPLARSQRSSCDCRAQQVRRSSFRTFGRSESIVKRDAMMALGRGADEQLPLVLGVGEPRDADVLAICEQVRDWMVEKMQEGPTRGWKSCTLIQDEVPRAVTNDLPEKYCVAITCLRTRRFNQIVYQFAHELLHVFVDPVVEHPLVEVFACLNSLAALRALAARWAASPSGGLRSYADKFTCYADAVVEAARKHYGFQGKDGKAVRTWARRLELDCNDRNAQILAASYLLPYCEELPAWTVIRLVHKAIQPRKCVEAQSWRASVSVLAWNKACQEVLTCDADTARAFILQVQDLFDLPNLTI